MDQTAKAVLNRVVEPSYANQKQILNEDAKTKSIAVVKQNYSSSPFIIFWISDRMIERERERQ